MNAPKLRSLLDMLRVNAYHYIQAAELLSEIESGIDPSWLTNNQALSPDTVQQIKNTLPTLATHCSQLHLETTETLITKFLMSYSVFGVSLSAPVAVIMVRGQVRHLPLSPTRQEAAIKIKCIKDAFESELQSKLFLFIFPHHAPYFSDDLETGREVSTLLEALSKFTKASRDAMEAGNCFAFERFTACVHHLSKVVEYGLVSFAAFAGVEGEDRKNWNKALNKAQHNLRERIGNFSGIDDRSEQYYSECLGLLRNFKTAWRNPVSHIPEFFDEPKAKALFTIANSTMTKLSERFGEVGMPEGKDENAN